MSSQSTSPETSPSRSDGGLRRWQSASERIFEATWPVSRFVGWRPANHTNEPSVLTSFRSNAFVTNIEHIVHTAIATFVSIVLLALVAHSTLYRSRSTPVVIGSFVR